MRFCEVIDGLIAGKSYRRAEWDPDVRFIRAVQEDGRIRFWTMWDEDEMPWRLDDTLTAEDVFADDWEEVK